MTQHKTICFINSVKSWGGGEKWHFEMALRLKNQGHNIIFICRKNSELDKKLRSSDIRVKHFEISNLSFLNLFKINSLRKFLEITEVEILIMNFSADIKTAGPAAKMAGVRRIIYRRGSAIPIKNSILNRLLFKKVLTDIIANSEATKKTILQNNPNLFNAEKIRVIYNGIDIDKTDSSIFYKRRNNEILLGNAGRLVHQKGQRFLIEIAKALKEKGINFTILIAGNGPLERELAEQIKTADLENEIKLMGFVKNINEFMRSIDIFLLTSLWEGFGFVLAEAMLNKKPIVAWDISSNPELVNHNVNGYLAPPFKVEIFTQQIINLIENPAKQTEFGEKGRVLAEAKFSYDETTNQLCRFLDI
ncbi:glycosyltransferase family 4 protein [Geofilum sp. OHC36d9]|uniref:glycosyltransferase family 4 protein n=1 Tax=Geofilum sp. OHC36d9 TaxID=3458413 RepID=UPI004034311F